MLFPPRNHYHINKSEPSHFVGVFIRIFTVALDRLGYVRVKDCLQGSSPLGG